MPSVRKLSAEEVRAYEAKGKGVRKLTEEQYDRALAGFEAGDYGEIIPDPDEKRLTARNRLKAAGQRRSLTLTFILTRGDAMRFKVGANDGQVRPKAVRRMSELQPEPEPEPEPVASDTPPTTKRGPGRPKKTSG